MAYESSSFVWYTLFTKDRAAAKAFYTEVIGWTAEEMEMPNGTYILFSAGGVPRGGISPMDIEAPPHWASYLRVDDVDAMEKTIVSNGGKVIHGGSDIPNVGRFAVVADPQGATFFIFRESGEDSKIGPPGNGAFHWTELWAKNAASVLGFYRMSFGFKTEVMQMPDGRAYHLLKHGDTMRGAVMTSHIKEAPPMWLPWVELDDIDAAAKRVTGHGGQVLMPPSDVPHVGRLLIAKDPTGAVLGMVTPARRG